MAARKSIAERFWEKVDRRGPDECWPWLAGRTGRRSGRSYGHFSVNCKYVGSHRVAWVLTNGPIPEGTGYHGTCVCHRCDNQICCNPAHLFLGTMADNLHDCISKGRRNQASGERAGGAKLTEADVVAIRASTEIGMVLARRYGVGRRCIDRIRNRTRWIHLH